MFLWAYETLTVWQGRAFAAAYLCLIGAFVVYYMIWAEAGGGLADTGIPGIRDGWIAVPLEWLIFYVHLAGAAFPKKAGSRD